MIDGEERNTDFYIENQTITPVSYQTHTSSQYYLSCLEDCVLAVGSDERNRELVKKIPLENIALLILEQKVEVC